jgi:hypothetical protein
MSYIGNQPTSVAFLTDQFSGTGSQTAFTLSAAPANTASILVAVSGVLQDPTTYSVSGLTLTFSAAPPSATGNISVRYLGIPASGVTTTAYRTVTEFTATAGQTTFSVPSYTSGYINVYRNGAMLGSADYTATNGTTVVLAAGASVGDLVATESFYVSSVLNAIPATNGAVTSAYLLDGAVTQAKLAAGVAGNGPAFSAYNTSAQSVANNTSTKIAFQTEEFDTASCYNNSTYVFTPNVAGYYQINATCCWQGVTANNVQFQLNKNGSGFKAGNRQQASGQYTWQVLSTLVYANGTTDYFEIYAFQNSGGSVNIDYGPVNETYFQACLVRSA